MAMVRASGGRGNDKAHRTALELASRHRNTTGFSRSLRGVTSTLRRIHAMRQDKNERLPGKQDISDDATGGPGTPPHNHDDRLISRRLLANDRLSPDYARVILSGLIDLNR